MPTVPVRSLTAARPTGLGRVALVLCAFLGLAGFAPHAQAVETVRFEDCATVFELGPGNLDYALAAPVAADDDPAAAPPGPRFARQAFAPAPGHRLNFGQASRLQLRFAAVRGACGAPIVLELGNPFANPVRLYRRDAGGEWVLDAARSVIGGRLRQALLSLRLERGVRTEFVVEIDRVGAVVLAPRIVSGIVALEAHGWRMALSGLIAGAIFALAAYCALLGAFTRFSGLVAFSASAIAMGGFYALSAGLLDQLLIWLFGGPEFARASVLRVGAALVLGGGLFHWIFVRRLLGGLSAGTLADRWIPALLALWVATLIVVALTRHTGVVYVSIAVALGAIVAVTREMVRAMKARHPLAPITVTAFAMIALPATAYAALVQGLLPGWGWMVHVVGLGILIEAILLAIAVAAQVRSLRGRHQRLAERTNELALLSQLDPLTGLGNRRAYDATVSEELERCQRRARLASLLVIDIDHFKQVNDTYGHEFGDSVIRILGATIANCVRSSDRAYRYGGEEFVVLLPSLGATTAREVGERIMREFTSCSPTAPDGTRPFFSVSIGLAQMRAGDDARALFARADSAMYRAKQNGRCRLESSEDPVALQAPAARQPTSAEANSEALNA